MKPVHEPELIARLNAGRRILALELSSRAANEKEACLTEKRHVIIVTLAERDLFTLYRRCD